MKMSAQTFTALEAAMKPLFTEKAIEQYETGEFLRADKVKDLNMRFRWDAYWCVRATHEDIRKAIREENLTDAHIDTALRKIAPTITRRY